MADTITPPEQNFLSWALSRLRTPYSASNYILRVEQEEVAAALADRGMLAFDGDVQRYVLTDAGIEVAEQVIRSGPLGITNPNNSNPPR
jgi:hypothetical protein